MNPTCPRQNCEGCPGHGNGHYVCHCLGVTEATVLDALASGLVHTVRDLCQATGAGDGCTACRPRLRQYLERHALTAVAVAAAG